MLLPNLVTKVTCDASKLIEGIEASMKACGLMKPKIEPAGEDVKIKMEVEVTIRPMPPGQLFEYKGVSVISDQNIPEKYPDLDAEVLGAVKSYSEKLGSWLGRTFYDSDDLLEIMILPEPAPSRGHNLPENS